MVIKELVKSTIKPKEIEILEAKVFVAEDIEDFSEEDFEGFVFTLKEYTKDEYINELAEKNKSLESQITETEEALIELYEMRGVLE